MPWNINKIIKKVNEFIDAINLFEIIINSFFINSINQSKKTIIKELSIYIKQIMRGK